MRLNGLLLTALALLLLASAVSATSFDKNIPTVGLGNTLITINDANSYYGNGFEPYIQFSIKPPQTFKPSMAKTMYDDEAFNVSFTGLFKNKTVSQGLALKDYYWSQLVTTTGNVQVWDGSMKSLGNGTLVPDMTKKKSQSVTTSGWQSITSMFDVTMTKDVEYTFRINAKAGALEFSKLKEVKWSLCVYGQCIDPSWTAVYELTNSLTNYSATQQDPWLYQRYFANGTYENLTYYGVDCATTPNTETCYGSQYGDNQTHIGRFFGGTNYSLQSGAGAGAIFPSPAWFYPFSLANANYSMNFTVWKAGPCVSGGTYNYSITLNETVVCSGSLPDSASATVVGCDIGTNVPVGAYTRLVMGSNLDGSGCDWWNQSAVILYATESTESVSFPQYTNASLNVNSTLAGSAAQMRIAWSSAGVFSTYLFAYDNGNGTFVNTTPILLQGSANTTSYNVTLIHPAPRTVRWYVWVNDTGNQGNTTEVYSFATTSSPWFVNSTANVNQTEGINPTRFSINASDDIGVTSYLLSLDNGNGTFVNSSAVAVVAAINRSVDLNVSSAELDLALNSTAGSLIRWKFFASDALSNGNFSETYSFLTLARQPPQIRNFSAYVNETRAGKLANFTLSASENTNLSAAIFSIDNGNGTFYNSSPVSTLGLRNNASFLYTLNSTSGTLVRWRMWFNDSANLGNTSETYSFNVSPATASVARFYLNETGAGFGESRFDVIALTYSSAQNSVTAGSWPGAYVGWFAIETRVYKLYLDFNLSAIPAYSTIHSSVFSLGYNAGNKLLLQTVVLDRNTSYYVTVANDFAGLFNTIHNENSVSVLNSTDNSECVTIYCRFPNILDASLQSAVRTSAATRNITLGVYNGSTQAETPDLSTFSQIGWLPYLEVFYSPDATSPQYLNGTVGVNTTVANQRSLFMLNWTDSMQLANYTISIDNGNTSFINESVQSMIGTANATNYSYVLNHTVGSTVSWRIYSYDYSGNLNVSETYSFKTTGSGASLFPQFVNSTVARNTSTAGTIVNLTINWTDATALSTYVFSVDTGDGTLANKSFVDMQGTTNTSWYSFVLNSTVGAVIRYRVWANNSFLNGNTSEVYSFATVAPDSALTVTINSPNDGASAAAQAITLNWSLASVSGTPYYCVIYFNTLLQQNVTSVSIGDNTASFTNLPFGDYRWYLDCRTTGGNQTVTSSRVFYNEEPVTPAFGTPSFTIPGIENLTNPLEGLVSVEDTQSVNDFVSAINLKVKAHALFLIFFFLISGLVVAVTSWGNRGRSVGFALLVVAGALIASNLSVVRAFVNL